MTTTAAEQPTELPSDNYGYETTTARRIHKTTTPAAQPTTRRSYYQTVSALFGKATGMSYDV